MITALLRRLATFSMASAKYRPVVMSGPSGSGKSTLLHMLFAEYPGCFAFSVSHTTRKPREGEKHGTDYFFVTREEMETAIANDEFIEHAEFSGNFYGTSKMAVQAVIDTGKICILDIEEQGVKSVKKTDINARYIFIRAPNLELLEGRLRGRGTETEVSLHKRMNTARSALEYASQKGVYDEIIVNDDKDVAYEQLKGYLIHDIEKVQAAS